MIRTDAERINHRQLLLLSAVLAWLLLCLPPAVGQSNSLFGARQRREGTARQVPTSQPSRPQVVPGKTVLGIRRHVEEQQPKPKTNAMLLRVSPYAVEAPEPEVIGVNDQVTIIIRENKSAKSDAKTEATKEWEHEWELSKWIKLSDKNGLIPALFEHGNPAVEFQHEDDYSGDGSYDRKDELTTRIQATVIDVKPNGTLVLEAAKTIEVDEERYTITVTGACRSIDVTPTNTILSTQIANLDIRVQHTGAIRDATRRGWFKRGLDLLRPF